MKILARLLRRWADAALWHQVATLSTELDAAGRKLAVVEAERDALAEVIARDRERIKAEGAAYARQRAESEGTPSYEQRDRASPFRHVS
jgi:hypothetical protein